MAAHNLLLQPPEPIKSHFFVTYGSALQMLRQRRLPECRDLVEKSFGSFLASINERRAEEKEQQVDEELASADALLAKWSEEDLAEYTKLEERLTAEKRAEVFLLEQEVSMTAQNNEALLPFVRAGTGVLLADGKTSGLLLEDAPPQLAAKLPTLFASSAVLLLVREGGGGEGEGGGDEVEEGSSEWGGGEGGSLSLRIAEPRHIATLDPEALEAPLPADALSTLLGALPPPAGWGVQPDGSLSADAPAAASTLGALIVPLVPPEPSAAVLKQQARVSWVDDQLAALPLHTSADRDAVLTAYRTRAELQRKAARIAKRQGGNAGTQDALAERNGAEPSGQPPTSGTWRQFEAVCSVLQRFGALELESPAWESLESGETSEASYRATEFGALVAELAGDNELWLALVMLELSDKTHLTAAQLAAVLSATLDERIRPNAYVGYFSSDPVLDVLEELEERSEGLLDAQFDAGLAFPATVEASACALVEAWANGEEWAHLLSNTSLDAGDIFRILRRTIELLRSVSQVPYVSSEVKVRAAEALRAMNRYPLADNVLMGLPGLQEVQADQQAEEEQEREASGEA